MKKTYLESDETSLSAASMLAAAKKGFEALEDQVQALEDITRQHFNHSPVVTGGSACVYLVLL